MSDNLVHLLEDYGTAATKTLCGIEVPKLCGSGRGTLLWVRSGRETCADCRKAHEAQVGQIAGTPSPPTKKAHPLFQVVRKSCGSPP
jgi:hypothetical protein